MRAETKVIAGIAILTLIILGGGIWLLTAQNTKEQTKLSKPLVGEEIADQGRGHVPDGTKLDFNSNPPTSGRHFAKWTTAGFYDKSQEDGNLVHSLEHGAVIVSYKSDLPKDDVEKIKSFFSSVSVSKKIMVPRDNLDVPVALTSWGRLLKLQTIDATTEAKIKEFMETNEDRGPEKGASV